MKARIIMDGYCIETVENVLRAEGNRVYIDVGYAECYTDYPEGATIEIIAAHADEMPRDGINS